MNKEEALKLADELDATKVNGNKIGGIVKASAMIRRLVEELDKQGGPFAWTDKEEMQRAKRHNCFLAWTKSYPIEKVIIPLYTTPQTKPLSDEEMEVVMFEEFGDILAPMQKNGYFKFARAILKKAREK